MATKENICSAQARLDRVLRHIGRPPLPDPTLPVLFEKELDEQLSKNTSKPAKQSDGEGNTHEGGNSGTTTITDTSHASNNAERVDDANSRSEVGTTLAFIPQGKSSYTLRNAVHNTNHESIDKLINFAGTSKTLVSEFCSFTLMAKFPYKYMDDPGSLVSQRFFAGNKFYERKWTLFYLNPPRAIGGKCLILIPLKEAQEFINEISDSFGFTMSVPPFPFTFAIYDDSTPQPSFLGISRSRDDASTLQQNVPYEVSGGGTVPLDASNEVKKDFGTWQERFALAQAYVGSKGARRSPKGSPYQLSLTRGREQIQRSEHYLGLYTPSAQGHVDASKNIQNDPKSFTEQDIAPVSTAKSASSALDIVFVCIDVESDERNHGIVTEIGVSTLDSLELRTLPPGAEGEDWIKYIQSRHIRISGTEHIRNSRWCSGNPDSFEFGQTEWVSLADVTEVIDDCLCIPCSESGKVGKAQTDTNKSGKQSCSKSEQRLTADNHETILRNVVLLGHDVRTDISYLTHLGCKAFATPKPGGTEGIKDKTDQAVQNATIVDILDTSTIDQAMRNDVQTRSLAKICDDVGITAWNLHNAGNDARYTLEAFIKLIIKPQAKNNNNNDENRLATVVE